MGNLNNDDIDTILSGDQLSEIRSTLSAGELHENCKACYEPEKNGNNQTLRQHYQTHYPYSNEDHELNFLDIRWNNKCNLSCQYCVPSLSSAWEKQLGIRSGSARKNYQDSLLEWILEKSTSVKEIMMVGGEPMLMKQNHALIAALPTDTQISIITNLNYEIENLSCFDNLYQRDRNKVIWNVSSENTGEQFEYVRNGSNWQHFCDQMKVLTNIWPNTVCLNMVYSVFSAFDFAETLSKYRKLGVQKFNIMPVTDSDEIDIFNWPNSTQLRAAKQLELAVQQHALALGTDADLYPINGADQLIKDLQSNQNHAIISKQQFITKINWYNQWHKASTFEQLWPHVWQEAQDKL